MMTKKEVLARVDRFKHAWSARMQAGFYGPILPEEEGRIYADGIIQGGKMTLLENPKANYEMPSL